MDKIERFLDAQHALPAPEFDAGGSDRKIHIADHRMARLLLLLHEIDHAAAGLEELPQTDLIELVSSAILACGFVDGIEARCAITAILEAIERRDPMLEHS
jgi:hypothetical protein